MYQFNMRNRLKNVSPLRMVLLFLPILFISLSPFSTLHAEQRVINQSPRQGIAYVQGEHANTWPSIISQAAVVMDMDTGTIVYGKNPNVKHYPASITKIMTALLALKYGHLTDELTASKNAVDQPADKLYMVPGEKAQLQPLLYGMLLDSANDVAVEIAEHYGGSVSHFAQMMNQEAAALGATHTHFVNPNGLPNPNHTTTAYDMSLIARAAMQYPEFRKIVQTKYYNWKGTAWQAKLVNLNGMLFDYPGCIGLKTGFTSVAHETLVVAAKHHGDTFLAVLMDAPTDGEIRQDATSLLNYAFAHYQTKTVVKAGQVVGHLAADNQTTVPVVASDAVVATVPKGKDAPTYSENVRYALTATHLAKGSAVGKLSVYDTSGHLLATVPVKVATSWNASSLQAQGHYWPLSIPIAIVLTLIARVLRMMLAKRRMRRRDELEPTVPFANSFES
ncbi:D-alanyl-D-alanine carboxypeptidase [Alicyclobacillus fodiniaquatilis]|uniref:serine-type D-Ala-D-Ala carboxypeptidase n=1 Tax=Alicyclobacillus fodiniaquatilis TaxID=1661150 RepID=A0ABW4JIY0_9BACL